MGQTQQVINQAINLIKEQTGIVFNQAQTHRAQQPVLTLKANTNQKKFTVVYKKHINNNQILGLAVNAIRSLSQKGMIVADYIAPMTAERLREMNIPFLDGVGNAYLNEPPVYVFINGNRRLNNQVIQLPKPFYAAALKVIFPLLCRPELINLPLRTLAQHTKVALGTVGNVMRELRIRKHIVVTQDGALHLVNLRALFQQWVMLYPTVLRPKLLIGRYQASENGWWKRTENLPGMLWGGEVAAAKLTEYLNAETVTIYAHTKTAQFLVKNRLKETAQGEVEILKAFWDEELKLDTKGLAPAVLVYTDLLASGDPRNIETAQMIYEQEIAGHLDKN